MKKTIILILVLLPIVLLSVIAIAGRVLSLINHISVESVQFVDRLGTPYTNELQLEVPQGGTGETYIVIYPELATNKKVSYTSSNPDICTIDENGVITGIHWGTAVVTVKTQDSSRVATVNVLVTADEPFGVTLSHGELSLFVGGTFDELKEAVDAPVSLDKRVRWTSSDASVVEVDPLLGTVKAKAPGEAVVTVTTTSGEKTASCRVTVAPAPPFCFDFGGIAGVEDRSDGVYDKYLVTLRELDLRGALRLADGVSADEVELELESGVLTRDGWVLTLNDGASGLSYLSAVYNVGGVTHKVKLQFLFSPG